MHMKIIKQKVPLDQCRSNAVLRHTKVPREVLKIFFTSKILFFSFVWGATDKKKFVLGSRDMKSLHDTALDILKIFPKYFNPQTIIVPVRQHIIHEFSRKMCNFTLPGLDVDESTSMRNLLNFKDFRFSSQGIESTT